MKYLSLLSLLFFFACGDTPSDPPKVVEDKPAKDSLIICDFDLDPNILGTVKREPVSDDEIRAARPGRGKKPIKPTDPTGSGVPTIYLDFDGYQGNTAWGNVNADNAGMTASEMQAVYENFYRLYNPFGIHVTTNETEYTAAPSNKRMRVVFTVTSNWYGNTAGGVAYVGSFNWGDNTPAFVFTALLNYNTKFIKDAGVHEAGHTLGLPHAAEVSVIENACSVLKQYLYGQNVMGVTYYEPTSAWGNAVYSPYCTTVDQFATIQNSIR